MITTSCMQSDAVDVKQPYNFISFFFLNFIIIHFCKEWLLGWILIEKINYNYVDIFIWSAVVMAHEEVYGEINYGSLWFLVHFYHSYKYGQRLWWYNWSRICWQQSYRFLSLCDSAFLKSDWDEVGYKCHHGIVIGLLREP